MYWAFQMGYDPTLQIGCYAISYNIMSLVTRHVHVMLLLHKVNLLQSNNTLNLCT